MPDRYGLHSVVTQRIKQLKQQTQGQNQVRQNRNQRIAEYLRQTTKQPFDSHPLKWWNWWQQHVDEHPEFRALSLQTGQHESLLHQSPSALDHRTAVWTNTGRRPIAKIQIGDLVLGQNVNTGEVQYKPVLGVVKSSAKARRIDFSDNAFLCAPGLPVWKAEMGWWLARDLQAGTQVHGLLGPHRVTNNSELIEVPTYHLAVADVGNFFISDSPILVHDVTQHQAEAMRVPGLARQNSK